MDWYDWLTFGFFLGLWLLIVTKVLPKFGVPT